MSLENASGGNKTVLSVHLLIGPKFHIKTVPQYRSVFAITGQEMSSKVVVSGRGDFRLPGSFMRQSAQSP